MFGRSKPGTRLRESFAKLKHRRESIHLLRVFERVPHARVDQRMTDLIGTRIESAQPRHCSDTWLKYALRIRRHRAKSFEISPVASRDRDSQHDGCHWYLFQNMHALHEHPWTGEAADYRVTEHR